MRGKKSFILYADLISVVSKLPDDKAGQLFKTILEYVNDQDPAINDLLLQIAFEPIKNHLKRDLTEWKQTIDNRIESGRLGGIKSGETRKNKANRSKLKQTEATLQISKQTEANEAVTVNVTVTDTEIQIQPVFVDVRNYFGFTNELKHISKWREINIFLRKFDTTEKLSYFSHQFKFYKQYKAEAKEKIHSFQSFLDGGWDAENWEHKLKELKKGGIQLSTVLPGKF